METPATFRETQDVDYLSSKKKRKAIPKEPMLVTVLWNLVLWTLLVLAIGFIVVLSSAFSVLVAYGAQGSEALSGHPAVQILLYSTTIWVADFIIMIGILPLAIHLDNQNFKASIPKPRGSRGGGHIEA